MLDKINYLVELVKKALTMVYSFLKKATEMILQFLDRSIELTKKLLILLVFMAAISLLCWGFLFCYKENVLIYNAIKQRIELPVRPAAGDNASQDISPNLAGKHQSNTFVENQETKSDVQNIPIQSVNDSPDSVDKTTELENKESPQDKSENRITKVASYINVTNGMMKLGDWLLTAISSIDWPNISEQITDFFNKLGRS